MPASFSFPLPFPISRSYSEYFSLNTEHSYGVLLANIERVRLFCSDESLPVIDAFRVSVLQRPYNSDALGKSFRALVDLSRKEVRR